MTILDFPTDICLESLEILARSAVGGNVSPYSFVGETPQDWGGERWELSLTFKPHKGRDAGKLEAFLLRLRGGVNAFRCGDLWHSEPLGGAVGSPVLSATATPGSETLATSGWSASPPDNVQLYAGDYIQVGTHLYRVLLDVATTSNAQLTVWPRVRQAYASGTAVVVRNARGLWVPASNNFTFSRDVLQKHYTSLQAVEWLPAIES